MTFYERRERRVLGPKKRVHIDSIAHSRVMDAPVNRLADFPDSGRVVPEVGIRRIRELIFGAYRVIYSVKDKVGILTVRRGSQLLQLSEIDDEQAIHVGPG